MATSVTLKKPGVEVYQVFEEQHPTALVPVLVPVIIGQNKNCQYQLRCGGLETGQVSGATISIPTGDSDIESQVIDSTTVRVFISTATSGIFEITSNANVVISLDADGTLTDTISILGELGVLTKTVISEYTSDSLSNYTDGGSNTWVRIYDKSADFLGSGVQVGDKVELNEDPTDANSTVSNKSIDLTVVQVESSVMLKCARTDASWAGVGNPITAETSIKYDVTRSVTNPVGDITCTYKAVRKDNLYTLQWWENTAELEEELGDATPDNPLAFGGVMALQSTDRQIATIKVYEDSITDYSKALEILEGYSLYCLVPLTHNTSVLGVCISHVDSMSVPANKRERTMFMTRTTPSYVTKTGYNGSDLDDPVWRDASAEYNNDGTSTITFTQSGLSLASAKIGDIVRTDIAAANPRLNSLKVDHSDITMQIIEVNTGTNAVKVLGEITAWNGALLSGGTVSAGNYAAITTPTLSGLDLANYVQEQNASLANRRVCSIFPEIAQVSVTKPVMDESTLVVANVTAVENVPSYFASCSIAGQVGQWKASQPHTETPVLGLSGVVGSTGYLSETALQVIAAGGTWILEQKNENAFVTTRHQLTTDISTVEKREYSITKQVDFGAMVFRLYLDPLIGPNVITPKLIKNQVRPAAQAALYALKREGVWGMGSKIDDIRVDSSDPTKLLIDVDVVALYPLVSIQVTLYV